MGFWRKVKGFGKKLLDTASRVAKRVAPVVQKIAPMVQQFAPMLGPKGAMLSKAAGIAGGIADRFVENDGDVMKTGFSFLRRPPQFSQPQVDSPRIGFKSSIMDRFRRGGGGGDEET